MQLEKTQVAVLYVAAPAINAVATFHISTLIADAAFLGNKMHYIFYHYESPNGKDVPLKVRLVTFFPNITLCEEGCENIGVNIETMKAKFQCKFIDLVNMDIMSENIYGQGIQEIFDIISELNLAVVKYFKDIFNKKYFLKNTGGFIILSLFIGQLICFIAYSVDGLFYIRKFLLNLVQSYIYYKNGNILSNNNINFPAKKKKKKK